MEVNTSIKFFIALLSQQNYLLQLIPEALCLTGALAGAEACSVAATGALEEEHAESITAPAHRATNNLVIIKNLSFRLLRGIRSSSST